MAERDTDKDLAIVEDVKNQIEKGASIITVVEAKVLIDIIENLLKINDVPSPTDVNKLTRRFLSSSRVLNSWGQVRLALDGDIMWSVRSSVNPGEIIFQMPGCSPTESNVSELLEYVFALLDVVEAAIKKESPNEQDKIADFYLHRFGKDKS